MGNLRGNWKTPRSHYQSLLLQPPLEPQNKGSRPADELCELGGLTGCAEQAYIRKLGCSTPLLQSAAASLRCFFAVGSELAPDFRRSERLPAEDANTAPSSSESESIPGT